MRKRILNAGDFTGILYAYDNDYMAETVLASVTDRSANNRTLTVDATASKRPIAFPRSWEQNGQPTISFDGAASCFAQDQSGSKLTYAAPLHQAGIAVALRCQVLGTGPILGNWGGATSNQNALSIEFNAGTAVLTVYSLSKAGGGTQHIAAVTTANNVRIGDVFTLIYQHKTDKTWTVRIVREARNTNDSQLVIPLSGSYGTTIDTGTCDFGLTIGAYGGLATFGSSRIHSLAIMQINSKTTSELAQWESTLSARCNFPFLAYDSDLLLTYPTDYSDATHWDDSGHAIVGARMIALEQAAVTALGATGTVKVGCIGDSRYAGTGASAVGTTSCRAIAQSGATFTRAAVGPVDDGGGTASKFHFARSGYITRTNSAPQSGHSQRTPSATTIDAFIATYSDTKVWDVCIGVNDISGAKPLELDYVDELVRIITYLYDTQRSTYGVTPAFVLVNEPVTGTTTTGPLQRTIRARNRAYHAAVAYLRALGITVKLGNINDASYNT